MPYATMDEQTDDAEPKRRTIVRQAVLRHCVFVNLFSMVSMCISFKILIFIYELKSVVFRESQNKKKETN